MSGFTANTHSNIKQVMRTALVGIGPADQLMLKGYLRVLLRLEADLEWVPANHPQVDLLFINEEFRSSNSVQRLLSNSPEKSILFVKRNQNNQGGLEGDTLTIPLKELPTLNRWLMQNISVLDSKDFKPKDTQAHTQISQSQRSASETKPAQTSMTGTDNTKVKPILKDAWLDTSSSNEPPSQSVTTPNIKIKTLVEFAKLVSKRPEGRYELLVNGTRIGIADLKRQRLWLSRENVVFDDTWQLKLIDDASPNGASIDLFQWIWSKVWVSSDIPSLVSENNTYQIRYWPKPSLKKDRTELLRVFTAIESTPRRIDDVAKLSETSTAMVKKVISGLLLSGGLKAPAYDKIDSLKTQTLLNHSEDKRVTDSVQPVVSTGSALDDALQRRALGQSAPVTSTVDINIDKPSTKTSPTPAAAPQKNEKSGFLSRLRKKLGL